MFSSNIHAKTLQCKCVAKARKKKKERANGWKLKVEIGFLFFKSEECESIGCFAKKCS